MTTLVLGAAGAIVGGVFGGPVGAQIGWLAGSLLGSLIDPPKVEGPRLNDLKLQTATYGKFIPLFWGAGRIGGNIIDQTDLVEHKEKSGGKGGPQVTEYTYSASFDIMLGAARVFGEPVILGVTRIWADGRLIWSNTDGTPCPFTIYDGSETQLPDPTFEAIHGVGQVPAYRGYAHVVATDYYLTDFGNRIPSFEFEVFTAAGAYPWQVSVASLPLVPGFNSYGWAYDNGVITVVSGNPTAGHMDMAISRYGIDMVPIGATTTTVINEGGVAGPAIDNVAQLISTGGIAVQWWNPDGADIYRQGLDVTSAWLDVLRNNTLGSNYGVTMNGFYYGLSLGVTDCYVNKWTINGGHVAQANLGTFNSLTCYLGSSDTGDLYIIRNELPTTEMWQFDPDLNLVHHWDTAAMAPAADLSASGARGNFFVYKNQIAYNKQVGTNKWIALVDIAPGFTLSDASNVLAQGSVGRISHLRGGLCANINYGVFSLDPPPGPVPLSTIVGNLTDMTPLTAYNVAELTDSVRWFAISSQMTVRNAIQTLRQVFFFDAVESDDLVRFRKRSMVPTFDIPDIDLCGRAYGEPSGDPLRTIRKKEQDLPRTVTLNYIDVDTDYQTGSQISQRQVTLSEQDVAVDVPVAFTADEAIARCLTLHTAEWLERESFEWSTTRKWAALEPGDVGTVRGRVIRIQTRTESPNGVIKWTGVLAAPSAFTTTAANIYIQAAPAAPQDGWVPPSPPGHPVATTMYLLDTPLISDTDFAGHYAALLPAVPGTWSGAAIYKSADGGATYASIANTDVADVVGTLTNTLGNHTGGNSFDEKNLLNVTIFSAGGDLVSASEAAVLNGANACLVGSAANGWEVLQFKTATLIATNIYTLSGLLRGRRGTEWVMARHAAYDTFILLPSSVNVNAPSAEIAGLRKYKAVTFGTALSAASAQDFINTGIAVKPYAPVHLEAGRNASGDLIIRWMRRTRTGGSWLEGVEVPMVEGTSEFYRVFIYTSGAYTTFLREMYVPAAQTATYLAADQTTDFGSTQATIYLGVLQGAPFVNGYETRGAL